MLRLLHWRRNLSFDKKWLANFGPDEKSDPIAENLRLAAVDLGLSPRDTLTKDLKLSVIRQAAQRLMLQGNRPEHVVAITKHADPTLSDNPDLAGLRCRALWQIGRLRSTIPEINRLMRPGGRREDVLPVLRDFVDAYALHHRIAACPDDHEWIWGEISEDLRAKITRLESAKVSNLLPGKTVDFLYHHRNDITMSKGEFIERLNWGASAQKYVRYLHKCASHISAQRVLGKAISERDLKILALRNQIPALRMSPDLFEINTACRNRKSIVVLMAHAGLLGIPDALFRTTGLPLTTMSRRAGNSEIPGNFNISSQDENIALKFLTLIKMMKKQPRLVRIFPDGADGDTIDATVFERKIRIGRGAASIAFHTGAATFFSTNRWTGTGIAHDMIPGPVREDGMSAEDYQSLFCRFYAGCLEGVISGPPEDIGDDIGGFLKFL